MWTGMGSVDEIQVTGKGESMSFVVKTVGDLVSNTLVGRAEDLIALIWQHSHVTNMLHPIASSMQDLN